MQATNPSAGAPEIPAVGASLRALFGNVLRMMALWGLLGILSGILAAPQPRGVVSSIAGAIAGVIVFTPLGAFLAVFAARRAEVLIAALIGLCLGAGVGLCVGAADFLATANMGLVLGGIIGSTAIPIFYRLPGMVLRLVRQTQP